MTTRIPPSSTPTTSGTGAGLEGNAPTTPAAPEAPATGTTSTSEFDGAPAAPASTAAPAGGETSPSPSKGKQAQMNAQKPVTKTPEPPPAKKPAPAPTPKIPETPAKTAPAPKPTPAPAPKAPEAPAKEAPPVQAKPEPKPEPAPAKPPETPAKQTPPAQAKPEPAPAKPPETPAKQTPPVQAAPTPAPKPAPAPAPAKPAPAPAKPEPAKPAPAPAPPKQSPPVQAPPVQAAPTKPAPAPAPTKQAPVQQKPVNPLPPQLKVENGAVVTPGGYKIIPTKQYEWKIVGPDGKYTRVWGDPHVAEGDGGKWDFKKDSVFVLPDGTKVAVTTTPWGNKGFTVTKRLDIIAGNDHIDIQGINTGKGKIGSLQNDGQAIAAGLRGDEFVMGSQTDDWYLGGKEIIGSSNSGDTLKLRGGTTVRAGSTGPTTPTTGVAALRANTEAAGGARAWYDNVSSSLMPLLTRNANSVTTPGVNAYSTPGLLPSSSAGAPYDAAAHQQAIMEALTKIFQLLAALQGTGGAQQPRVFNA